MKPASSVSVVVPTYNRARILGAALDSIYRQTVPVDEVIVVDDGSTDDTSALIQRYPGIRYLRQQNAGPAAARNRGIREARGDLVAFLDSDDLWVLDKTERQLAFMRAHPEIEISFGLMANFTDESEEDAPEIKDGAVYRQLQAHAADVRDMFSLLLQWNAVPTPTVMIRRECFARTGYFPENFIQAEDYALWLNAARVCRWGFIDSVLLRRRRHESNLINDWASRKELVANLLQTIVQGSLSASEQLLVRRKLSDVHYDLGSFYAKKADFAKAAAHLERVDAESRPAMWYPKIALSSLLSRVNALFGKAG